MVASCDSRGRARRGDESRHTRVLMKGMGEKKEREGERCLGIRNCINYSMLVQSTPGSSHTRVQNETNQCARRSEILEGKDKKYLREGR